MPQDKPDLPEGTDEVISGASTAPIRNDSDPLISSGDAAAPETLGGIGRNSAATGDELVTTERRSTRRRGGAGRAAASTTKASETIAARLRSGGEKISGQAADKARGLVTQGLERGSEALANVGKLVGDTASGLDERLGPEYGEYARRAAGAIEGAANSLAEKDPDELIEDTKSFVRNSPGVALAGAAIIGFALARLIKTGLARNDDEDDRG